MKDQNVVAPAGKSGHARMGFFIHLAAYLVVNAGLIFINLFTTPERLWFQWPLAGWGIGIVAHALAVFVLPRFRNG